MLGIFEYLSAPIKSARPKQLLLLLLCALIGLGGAAAILIFATFLMQFAYAFAGVVLILAALAFFFLVPYTEIEFEYQIIEGIIEIDRVLGRRFRRTFFEASVNTFVEIQRYDPSRLTELEQVTVAADVHRTEDLYTVFYRTEAEQNDRCALIVHLPPEVYARFCTYCPRMRKS